MFKFLGALIGRRDTDYEAGGPFGLEYFERLPSADWTPFIPPFERQYSARGDSQSCVTFSQLNSIETQEFFYFNRSNDYSDRFTAKHSNTLPNGNYAYKVADDIRKFGIIPESSYPTPDSYTWAEFHADIPQDQLTTMEAEGARWLKFWNVAYEWVPLSLANLKKHLKHAPIQVLIEGHALLLIRFDGDTPIVYDTYAPFVKSIPFSAIKSALKLLITPKLMTNAKLVQKGQEWGFYLAATTEDAMIDKAMNYGYPLPTINGGKNVDWTQIKPDITIPA